jgi:hypothetical protein
VLQRDQPEEREAGEREAKDETTDGVAKAALGEGSGDDRQGREEYSDQEKQHASIIVAYAFILTR